MPKVRIEKIKRKGKLSDNSYLLKYNCVCGLEISLYTDSPEPEKVIKCFECIKKETRKI